MDRLRHCAVEGRLRGVLCARRDIFDAIAGAEIYALSPARGEASVRTNAAAEESLKTVLRRIETPELAERRQGSRLVMHGTTSADGGFCLAEPAFEGGTVDLYAAISSSPLPGRNAGLAKLERPWILYLGA